MEMYNLKKGFFFKQWSTTSNIVKINGVWKEDEDKWLQGQNIHHHIIIIYIIYQT